MNELWNLETVSAIVNENCLSVRLEAGSAICEQFKQIYPISEFPTTYLVGLTGQPLTVISGSVNEEELLNKINEAVDAFNLQKSAIASAPSQNQNEASTSAAAEPLSAVDQKSLDERVALARAKVKALQEKKKAEEEERERNSEMERRRMGQDVLRMKKEKEDQEMRKLAEERRREKLDDEQAKKRIMEKIQQDREDKQKKYSQEKVELDKVKEAERVRQDLARQQEKAAEAARNSNVARIQFRFTDGSSTVGQFEPDQLLRDAHQFVEQRLKDIGQSVQFGLHSSFPKREYTVSDMDTTLRQLGLAPSASLLVIPKLSKAAKTINSFMPSASASTSSGSGSSSGGIVAIASDVASFLFLPFTIIYSLVMSFFTGPGAGRTSNASGERAQASGSNVAQSRQPESAATLRRRNIDSRQGNIRDIRDDDENATWNGNSTQQM